MYTAIYDSVESDEALKNPFNPKVTLGTDFLYSPYLKSLIIDTHFFQRDRMGRLVVFLARLMQAQNSTNPQEVLGIGCDEQTAILVDGRTGNAMLVSQTSGLDHVCYFLSVKSLPKTCEPNQPLTFVDIEVFRAIPHKSTFNFISWKGSGESFPFIVFELTLNK